MNWCLSRQNVAVLLLLGVLQGQKQNAALAASTCSAYNSTAPNGTATLSVPPCSFTFDNRYVPADYGSCQFMVSAYDSLPPGTCFTGVPKTRMGTDLIWVTNLTISGYYSYRATVITSVELQFSDNSSAILGTPVNVTALYGTPWSKSLTLAYGETITYLEMSIIQGSLTPSISITTSLKKTLNTPKPSSGIWIESGWSASPSTGILVGAIASGTAQEGLLAIDLLFLARGVNTFPTPPPAPLPPSPAPPRPRPSPQPPSPPRDTSSSWADDAQKQATTMAIAIPVCTVGFILVVIGTVLGCLCCKAKRQIARDNAQTAAATAGFAATLQPPMTEPPPRPASYSAGYAGAGGQSETAGKARQSANGSGPAHAYYDAAHHHMKGDGKGADTSCPSHSKPYGEGAGSKASCSAPWDAKQASNSQSPSGSSSKATSPSGVELSHVTVEVPVASPGHEDGAGTCIICLEGASSYLYSPCGHLCICDACIRQAPTRRCPVCRAPSAGQTRVYMV